MSDPKPPKDQLFVSQILDKTTLVIAGAGVETLLEGDILLVLAKGAPLTGTDIPVFVPKAKVEVTLAAGPYAIARPPEVKVVHRDYFAPMLPGGERVSVERPTLRATESQMTGNPAFVPIGVGDPVVRPADLKTYVKSASRPTP
jgi:hypothetical protein